MADLNQNGRLDLALSQNFYGPQPETGRWAGGVGLLLEGQGNARFAPLAPARSGLVAADDGRSIRAVDIDGDGVLELALVAANGPLRVFRRRVNPGVDSALLSSE